MLLPKPYISVSQINLWYSDRQKYINRYFLNLAEEPSIYMNFGKQFAEDTEAYIKDGIIMETFPDFYIDKIQSFKGCEAEKEISEKATFMTGIYADIFHQLQASGLEPAQAQPAAATIFIQIGKFF